MKWKVDADIPASSWEMQIRRFWKVTENYF